MPFHFPPPVSGYTSVPHKVRAGLKHHLSNLYTSGGADDDDDEDATLSVTKSLPTLRAWVQREWSRVEWSGVKWSA